VDEFEENWVETITDKTIDEVDDVADGMTSHLALYFYSILLNHCETMVLGLTEKVYGK
jgi:hypothetical protein